MFFSWLFGFEFDEERFVLYDLDAALWEAAVDVFVVALCDEEVFGWFFGGTDEVGEELFEELEDSRPCEAFEGFEFWSAGAEAEYAVGVFHASSGAEEGVAVFDSPLLYEVESLA